MKKFTLISALMLFAVVAFAQRSVNMPKAKALPVQAKMAQQVKALDRKATTTMRKAPRKADELVTAPNAGEQWYIADGGLYKGTQSGWTDVTSDANIYVCIDGSDIYIKGLAYWFPEGWIKGTISGSTATFPCGQMVGEDDYGPEYMVGQPAGAETGEEPGVDIVFDYDAVAGTLSLNESVEAILESASPNALNQTYCYWYGLVLTKEPLPEPELVVAPSEGEEWTMESGKVINYDNTEKDWIDATSHVENPFRVLIDGTDIYIQGIDNFYFPEGWIKGTISGSQAIFPSNQFVGGDEYGDDYIVGADKETGEIVDIIFAYDAEKGTLTLDDTITILISGKPNRNDYYFYFWTALTLVKNTTDGINAISKDKNAGTFYNLQGVKVNPTQKGIYIQNGRKMVIK